MAITFSSTATRGLLRSGGVLLALSLVVTSAHAVDVTVAYQTSAEPAKVRAATMAAGLLKLMSATRFEIRRGSASTGENQPISDQQDLKMIILLISTQLSPVDRRIWATACCPNCLGVGFTTRCLTQLGLLNDVRPGYGQQLAAQLQLARLKAGIWKWFDRCRTIG